MFCSPGYLGTRPLPASVPKCWDGRLVTPCRLAILLLTSESVKLSLKRILAFIHSVTPSTRIKQQTYYRLKITLGKHIVIVSEGDGRTAQWLRAIISPVEDQGSTPTRWLTTVCNSNSGGFDGLFAPLRHLCKPTRA